MGGAKREADTRRIDREWADAKGVGRRVDKSKIFGVGEVDFMCIFFVIFMQIYVYLCRCDGVRE